MDPQPLTQPKKKGNLMKVLLVVLLGVFIIGAAVYFFLLSPAPAPQTATTDIIPSIDFSIFESESFERFKVWGVIPVTVGETGKENPFSE